MFPTAPNGWFIMTMHQRHRDAGCYGNEDMRPVSKSFIVAFVKYPKGNHMQMAQAETMDEAWKLAVGMTEAFDAVHKPGGIEQPKSLLRPSSSPPEKLDPRDIPAPGRFRPRGMA